MKIYFLKIQTLLTRLKNRLNQFNHWPVFNTALWPEKESIIRSAAFLLILMIILYKIPDLRLRYIVLKANLSGHDLFNKIEGGRSIISCLCLSSLFRMGILILENLVLVTYLLAYFSRMHARRDARTFMETVFPFFIASLPMLIASFPFRPVLLHNASGTPYPFLFVMMILGYVLNLTGLLALRTSFSMMVEVRELKKGGIYRWIRHPMYMSHFITFGAILLLRFSILNLFIYCIFIIGQVIRANMEENMLINNYPAYRDYQKTTGMFLPKLW